MKIFKGKSVYEDIAIGKIKILDTAPKVVEKIIVEDADSEIDRFSRAKDKCLFELRDLYEKALKELGEENAAIFEVHQMMLMDEDYNDAITKLILEDKVNAEYAVSEVSKSFAKMFSDMEDEYMRERVADIRDVSNRLINILMGGDKEKIEADKNIKEKTNEILKDDIFLKHNADIENAHDILGESGFIILAKDLSPSETVQLEKDKIVAFVTFEGSTNSHTAILARTMGIPALVKTEIYRDDNADTSGVKDILIDDDLNGKLAIVDGQGGLMYIDPDEETIMRLQNKKNYYVREKEELSKLVGKETVTLDNKRLMLYANIGNLRDLELVLENDAEGIGLFRSEFLYLEKEDYPTEEEQFVVYKKVAETMKGKNVIIRTLDIGADKKCDYFNLKPEVNPALGYRAIRICLSQTEVFKTQLRALLRASVYGNISIMYPMITNVWEIIRIKEIFEEVKNELKDNGISYKEPKQGIMIETPAAVMISDLLAREVDFFSIGTNDLTQYTLAVDRENESIDEYYDAHHEAILRMIKQVIDNGHKEGIWVGICGELASDKTLTKEFLRMGIDELSVAPTAILPIRKIVRETK